MNRSQLQYISPLSLEFIFFLIIIAVIINLDNFKRIFSAIPKRAWLYLTAIILTGIILSSLVAPRVHRIYYDEDIYMNAGQNIAFMNRAGICNHGNNRYGEYDCFELEYNKQPNGWPFIISLTFKIFGVNELFIHIVNNIIYGLSIAVVFLISWFIYKDTKASFFSCLVFLFIPMNIIWSNTTAVEPSASFFTGLAVLAALFYKENRDLKSLFLSMVIMAFSIQFRPESVMILPVCLLIMQIRKDEIGYNHYLILSVFFILILPHIAHLKAVSNEDWGSSGARFSIPYFLNNIKVNTLFYIENSKFPVLFTILSFCGMFIPPSRFSKEGKGELLIILLWFLLFWGIFLFFYAGGYDFGADVRFSLLSYMPLSVVAGRGMYLIENILYNKFNIPYSKEILITFFIAASLSFFPLIRAAGEEAWGARADHQYAKKMADALPLDSIVLTHNPNMFLLWGKNAAQAVFVNNTGVMTNFFNRYKGGVYFHYNYWCNVEDPQQQGFCRNVLKRYKNTIVKSFKERDYVYNLYRLERQ